MEQINYEIVNSANLDILANLRREFWSEILNSDQNTKLIEISILDSQCPECKIFIKNTDKSCTNCGIKFSEKVVKFFKKDSSPKRGKKLCPGCELYVAVRTFICDCGWDFKNKLKRNSESNKINNEFFNIKKKKSKNYPIHKIENLDILIKNDIIKTNFAKVLNKSKNPIVLKIGKEFKDKRDALFNFNKKLGYDISNKFYPKSGCIHLKKEDFVSAANIGLLKAIDHYDSGVKNKLNPDKSVSFSTYATFWIKREIIDQINKKEKDIRIPDYIINIYKTFNNYYNTYLKENQKEPSIEDIMEQLNIKKKKAEGLVFTKTYEKIKISIEDIGSTQTNPNNTKLNLLKNCDSNNKLTYFINEEKFELGLIDWNKIKFRNDTYRQIFYNLYGLHGFNEEGVSELEKKYGITKVTISKIEKETIDKIKRQLGELYV